MTYLSITIGSCTGIIVLLLLLLRLIASWAESNEKDKKIKRQKTNDPEPILPPTETCDACVAIESEKTEPTETKVERVDPNLSSPEIMDLKAFASIEAAVEPYRLGAEVNGNAEPFMLETKSADAIVGPEAFTIEGTTLVRCSPEAKGIVVIPEGITKIGNQAFMGCRDIKSIRIPETVTSIGDYAFAKSKYSNDCVVDELYIPNHVSHIGDCAFGSCYIMNAENNPYFVEQDGVLFTKDNKEIIYGYDESYLPYEVPHCVEIIHGGAFFGMSTVRIILPKGIRHINEDILYIGKIRFTNEKPKDLHIHKNAIPCEYNVKDSVIKVPHGSIDAYKALLDKIEYKGTLVEDSEEVPKELLDIQNETLVKCDTSAKGRVVVPEGVKVIASKAFYLCDDVKEVELPDSLEEIGECVFRTVSGFDYPDGQILESICIPRNVSKIGAGALYDIRRITIDLENPYFTIRDNIIYSKDMSEIVHCFSERTGTLYIPDGVKVIRSFAFEDSFFTEYVIPKSVQKIEMRVFSCYAEYIHLLNENPDEIQLDAHFGENDERDSPDEFKVTVPANSLKAYKKKFHDGNIDVELIAAEPLSKRILGRWEDINMNLIFYANGMFGSKKLNEEVKTGTWNLEDSKLILNYDDGTEMFLYAGYDVLAEYDEILWTDGFVLWPSFYRRK